MRCSAEVTAAISAASECAVNLPAMSFKYGRVSVSRWLDGEDPGPASEPFAMAWPLDAEALEDVRWYLEDYLRAPYGVYGDRGARVATRLRPWGEAILWALFGAESAGTPWRVHCPCTCAKIVARDQRGGFAMSDGEREILERVGVDRRSFIKRMLGSAFAIPVVTSFGLNALTMSSAAALAPNQGPPPGQEISEFVHETPPQERGGIGKVLGGLAQEGLPPGRTLR